MTKDHDILRILKKIESLIGSIRLLIEHEETIYDKPERREIPVSPRKEEA